jgi:hypothetical protein
MTTDFSRNVTPATIAALQTNVADLSAGGTELATKGLPQLAALLKLTPEQFATLAQQQFPALTAAVTQIPQTTAGFDKLLGVIASQDAHLRSAAAIPTKGISTTVVPWVILGTGIIALALGLKAGVRWTSLVAVALGAVMIIGVFAFSLPSKTSDSDALNKAIKPFFTQQQIDASRAAMTGLNTTSQELINKVLPAIAAAQHVPASTLTTQFAGQFPALTRALISLPDATDKVTALTAVFERNLSNFHKVEPFHFAVATWTVVALGLLVMLGGALPLLVSDEAATSERSQRWFHRAA